MAKINRCDLCGNMDTKFKDITIDDHDYKLFGREYLHPGRGGWRRIKIDICEQCCIEVDKVIKKLQNKTL